MRYFPNYKPFTLHPFEVRAAKEGRLAQIRRPVNLHRYPHLITSVTNKGNGSCRVAAVDGVSHVSSPILFPGSVLWARETWSIHSITCFDEGVEADEWCGPLPKSKTDRACISFKTDNCDGPWRSTVTMPSWASRFDIHVKDVRVERLQDMTEYDVTKLGWSQALIYARHWDNHHAKRGYGWDTNPWVWVADVKTEKRRCFQ